jgi:hypothetical protein
MTKDGIANSVLFLYYVLRWCYVLNNMLMMLEALIEPM